MRIKIFSFGKIKEPFLKIGINEYLLRIKPYCNVQIIELYEEQLSDNPSQSDIEKAKAKEGGRMLKLIKPSDYVIALDLDKKQFSSPDFASYLESTFVLGGSQISFVIGGSYGLSENVKKRANDSFSLSSMTFIHQMSCLILLEQIYRSFKINRNETYHK